MTWKQGALAALATALTAHLLLVPFRQGWSQMGTDFPNYYTAAKLTRQGQPLRLFYDWTWFQRQIHYAGIDHQLGGYVPHTPATMLPFIPLSFLEPQTAKRAWLLLELLFLAASIVLLSRLSGLSLLETLVLALLAHAALGNNFVIGQYYLFILLLLICGIGCLLRGRDALGGALIGLIFTLKLYTAPFLLLFAVRRQWKAAGGFLAVVAAITAVAVAIFGPHAIWYFATTVLLRGLDGTVNDPYNPYWASMTAFLRHTLLFEPELNPHPFTQAPALFDFLHALYTLGVLAVALLVLSRRSQPPAHAFAWFTIVLFVLSPNTASYHYILLLVPVALLLKGADRLWAAGLIVLYVLVELPLYPWDARFFPKAWLLLALAIYAGTRCWRAVNTRALLATVAAVAVIAAVHRTNVPQEGNPAIVVPGSNFSTNPSMTAAGPVYQAMGFGAYVLRGNSEFAFEDDAFHPSATRDGKLVYFELCANGRSRIARVNPATREVATIVSARMECHRPRDFTGRRKAGLRCGPRAACLGRRPAHTNRFGRDRLAGLLPR